MKTLLALPLILMMTSCGGDEEIDYSPFYGKWVINAVCDSPKCDGYYQDLELDRYIEFMRPNNFVYYDGGTLEGVFSFSRIDNGIFLGKVYYPISESTEVISAYFQNSSSVMVVGYYGGDEGQIYRYFKQE